MKDRVWRERIRSPKSVEDMKYNVPIFRQKNKKRDYLSTWLLSPVLRNFKLFHLCEVAGVWGRGLGYRVVPQGGKSGQKGCGGGRGRHSSGGQQGPFTAREGQQPEAHTGLGTGAWADSPWDLLSTLPLELPTEELNGHLPALHLLLGSLFQSCIQLFENSTLDGRIEQNGSFVPLYLPLGSWCQSCWSGMRCVSGFQFDMFCCLPLILDLLPLLWQGSLICIVIPR